MSPEEAGERLCDLIFDHLEEQSAERLLEIAGNVRRCRHPRTGELIFDSPDHETAILEMAFEKSKI